MIFATFIKVLCFVYKRFHFGEVKHFVVWQRFTTMDCFIKGKVCTLQLVSALTPSMLLNAKASHLIGKDSVTAIQMANLLM